MHTMMAYQAHPMQQHTTRKDQNVLVTGISMRAAAAKKRPKDPIWARWRLSFSASTPPKRRPTVDRMPITDSPQVASSELSPILLVARSIYVQVRTGKTKMFIVRCM